MKLHVLILTHHFFPEFGGGATMQYELAKHLAASGHQVTVITPIPYHHMVSADIPEPSRDENLDGFHVIRVRSHGTTKGSLIARAICEVMTDIDILFRGLKVKPVDILYIMPPPITLPFLAAIIKWVRKSKMILFLQDTFPEFLISMNLLSRKNICFKIARVVEKMTYWNVDYLGVHSPKNRSYIISRGVNESKVHVIPLWADTDFLCVKQRPAQFLNTHQLDHKFVVMYAGTIGFAIGAKTLPQTAKILEGEKEIQFVVIGGGNKKNEMQEEMNRLGTTNMMMFSPIPREDLPDALASSDILLVMLRKEQSNNPNGYFKAVIPHKMLSDMASGRPILLSAEMDSNAADLVRIANCGLTVPPEDPAALAEAILRMKQDEKQRALWAKNGYEFARNHFSSSRQVQKMEEMFISVAAGLPYQFNDPWHPEPN